MAEIKDVRRPLGRGLGSLLGDDFVAKDLVPHVQPPPLVGTPASSESLIHETQRIWSMDVEKLSPNLYQPRKVFVPEHIQDLAASIKEKGILQPIVARRVDQDKFEIVAGERRWRAAQLAGLTQVPVIIKEAKNQESLELALIENIQRQDLNPIEEAEAYERLAEEFGLSQQEIADKVGKERATVANSLRLLGLSPEVKQMLSTGELTAGHAKALLAMPDPIKQRELARRITSEKLTVRAAEKIVQSVTKRSESTASSAVGKPVDIASTLVRGLRDDLIKKLGTKVEIAYQSGKGEINIRFYNDEDLTRITHLILNRGN